MIDLNEDLNMKSIVIDQLLVYGDGNDEINSNILYVSDQSIRQHD